jgi:hypothetical protein
MMYIYKVEYTNENDLDEEIAEAKIRTFAIGKGSTEAAAWADFERDVEETCRLGYQYKLNKEQMKLFIEDCDIQLTMNIIFREEVKTGL